MNIVLADDEPTVRSAIRLLLEQESSLYVCGEADELTNLLELVKLGCPNILLLDWELPGLSPKGTIASLRALCPSLRIIAMSGLPEASPIAMAAGCDAFVSKGDPPESLLSAVYACSGG